MTPMLQSILQNSQNIIAILELVGFVVMMAVVLFLRGKSGAEQVSNDIITTYKLRVEQLEADQKRNIERMHEHTKEIGQLQGALQEKDKEIGRMRAILENRDPELVNVLKEIRLFMQQINIHMQKEAEMRPDLIPAPQYVENPHELE